MDYSSTYNLDLPTHIVEVVSQHISAHMEKIRGCVCVSDMQSADFIVPGVLHIPNVLFFEGLECSPPKQRGIIGKYYASNIHRSQIAFTVWQQIPNL